jgi:hypothetical protein
MMNYHKTIAGAVCTIASGAWGVMMFLGALLAALLFGYFNVARLPSMYQMPRDMTAVMAIVYLVMAVFSAALAALSIVGGIFALRRKRWGLAVAGAIAGIFTFFPTGVAAVVLLAMGKAEFMPDTPRAAPLAPVVAPTPPAPPVPPEAV